MKVVQAEASSLCTGMKFEDKDGIDRPVRMIKPGAWAAALGRAGEGVRIVTRNKHREHL